MVRIQYVSHADGVADQFFARLGRNVQPVEEILQIFIPVSVFLAFIVEHKFLIGVEIAALHQPLEERFFPEEGNGAALRVEQIIVLIVFVPRAHEQRPQGAQGKAIGLQVRLGSHSFTPNQSGRL